MNSDKPPRTLNFPTLDPSALYALFSSELKKTTTIPPH